MPKKGRSKYPEYGGAPSRRKFGGEWFKNAGGIYSKSVSQSRASSFREKGYKARISKVNGGYAVYYR